MSVPTNSIDITKLPLEIRAQIAELDLEVAEGDITEKGYEKKKSRLLEPYINDPSMQYQPSKDGGSSAKFNVNGKQKKSTLMDRNEGLYTSNAHSVTVQHALAQNKSKRIPILPLPVRRNTLAKHDLVPAAAGNNSSESASSLQRAGSDSSSIPLLLPSQIRIQNQFRASSDLQVELRGVLTDGKAKSDDAIKRRSSENVRTQRKADSMPRDQTANRFHSKSHHDAPTMFTSNPVITSSSSLNAVTATTSVSSGSSSPSVDEQPEDDVAVTKVSAKIQQLLLTLKRPKKKSYVEYFQDDQDELPGFTVDENAPKPTGVMTSPRMSNPFQAMVNIPQSIEAAIQRYGTSNPKSICLTSLDQNGKQSYTLTYEKLLSRVRKITYTLTSKRNGLQPGQRIALVFPNQESVAFLCVFHACLYVGLVPVVVEIPQSSEDPGSAQLGFLLGSCGITVAVTTEHCFKNLPKTEKGEVIQLKGWPKLQWILADSRHLNKPPNNWEPPKHNTVLAYIEYKTGKEGSVVGIAHSRASLYRHCRALIEALAYNTDDVMLNMLDFQRGLGLVHGMIASVFSGMHIFCIPYALTKQNPAQWLHIATKNKATLVLARSRDLHWTLAVQRDSSNVNLSSLRMLLVSDGTNPWSIASCDLFLSEYERRGLGHNVVCPCAWSNEALTVAVKRSGTTAVRTALSLHDLSYNVVHEEKPNSQVPCIVLQDCGKILPNSIVAVVKFEGEPRLCQSDEVGEILLCNDHSNGESESCYFGLAGVTEKVFKSHPITSEGIDSANYIRTGLVGYLTSNGRVLVTGLTEEVVSISGRMHNTNDIVATILAVEPIRFVHKSRIAIFSFALLKDERLVVVAEQKQDASEDRCYKWMTSVLQAVEGIHSVAIYCLCLLPPDGLPRSPLGAIHFSEVKTRFLEGKLHPRHVMMCPHQCVTNLPNPRQKRAEIGLASILQGQVVKGMKMSEAKGNDLNLADDDPAKNFSCLSEILKWRAQSSPDHFIFSQIGPKGTITSQLSCGQLHKKAEKIAQLLLSQHSSGTSVSTGDHVALLLPPGFDLVAAFYGCLYAGCVPVPIRPPNPRSVHTLLLTVKMITKVSKVVCILSCAPVLKLIRSKEAAAILQSAGSGTTWSPLLDIDDAPKKRVPITYKPPTAELLAYLDFSVTNSGTLTGVKMSHFVCCQLCRSIKIQCSLSPIDSVALCIDPYSGLGFALSCLSSVYSGHRTIFITPSDLEVNPQLWLSVVTQYKIRDVFVTYTTIDANTRELAAKPPAKGRNINLSHVKSCVIVAEERPRVALINNFTKLLHRLELSPQVVSTSFGCHVNPAMCLQGFKCPTLNSIYIDAKALRNERISIVERGSPHSLCLVETGKVLPGTRLVIANPENLVQCSDSSLGEIWVSSPYTSQGYFVVQGGDADLSYQDHFQATLKTGDTRTKFARTGYIGFLKKSDKPSSGGNDPSVYVVGSLAELIEVRGYKYHPIDIENSVLRCSNKVAGCVVFQSNNILVVIVELDGAEYSALDLVPLVTNVILKDHYLIAGVVAVTDLGSIPFNSRGEKQRMHLRDAFLHDRLDPIYVAYNT